MRVAIITGGSRGDVQPYVALGKGLTRRGHEVKVATYAPFEGFVRDQDLEFAHLSGDPARLMEHLLGSGLNQVRFVRRFREALAPFVENNVEECLDACRDVDAVVYTAVGFVGSLVAEKLKLPAVGAVLQPLFTPTREFPSALFPEARIRDPRLRGLYNLTTFFLTEQGFWQTFRPLANGIAARKLGLPRIPPLPGPFVRLRRRGELILYGWSPTVLPEPRDWGPWARAAGYWFLDRPHDWRPPAHLDDFLQSGPPPVCVGFGSMSSRDAERVTETILGALRSVGRRGLLLSGWGGISNADLPDEVLKIEEAPHDWLFPRVRAAVHHGGSGTTGAALRAGIPSVVVPFFADQPFWGRRVARLGAGTAPIPQKRLSEKALTEALRRVDGDAGMRERAAILGERIRAEDGVERAVSLFEQYVHEKEAAR